VKRHLLLFLLAAILPAQEKKTTDLPEASVSGVVKDLATGRPLANYSVSTEVNATWVNDAIYMSNRTKQVKSVTDDSGRYKLSGLPAGPYRIEARSAQAFGSAKTRRITVAGQDMDSIDFNLAVDGIVTGKVLDEFKEPLPGMQVYLISAEYYSGALGYFIKSIGVTDDRGAYKLTAVEAEHAYLVMTEPRASKVPAHSVTPVDPRLRRRVAMRTFYPNSPTADAAASIALRSGEHREGVNIEVRKSANFCAEGTLTGPTGTGEFLFSVEGAQPTFGMSSTGGFPFSSGPVGKTSGDGRFRICELSPGVHRLSAFEQNAADPEQFGKYGPNRATMLVAIADQDVKVKLGLTAGPVLDGAVAWDGDAPAEPVKAKLRVWLTPLLRPQMPGERPEARSDIPGTFTLNTMTTGDYAAHVMFNAQGIYVKDVRYAGQSILHQPLHPGETMGSGLAVVLRRDGATISARVTDKDGAPVSDIPVLLIPADAASPAVVQTAMVVGTTDQLGQFTSHTIAPGRYYVVATNDRIDATPACIDHLWQSRNKFTEMTIAPNAAAQVTLSPVTM
jgi:protocatechuate 3,4-dioxygenase beta subunit